MKKNKMKKIGIIGAFDFKNMDHSGQPVKTREVYYAFCEKYGKENVEFVETFGKKNYFKLLIKSFLIVKNCEQIAMLPAHNGVKIFAPLLDFLNKIFKRRLYYFVIGGWLPNLIKSIPKLINPLKSFDCIFVETNTTKSELERIGFNNIVRVENFRNSSPVSKIKFTDGKPYKLCFFSRVVKQKGVLDAIDVIQKINKAEHFCDFDIYGMISEEFAKEFADALKKCGSHINYKGFVQAENSVETLKNYDLHIFPTNFKTEGIPGSIVDSFFAGVPVVSSKWNSFNDVISDGITGIGYEFGNLKDFENKLKYLLANPDKIDEMKRNCVRESQKYITKNAIKKIETYLIDK